MPHRAPLNRRLGSYHLLEEIGRGGMGVVYKALHERLNSPRALKVLSPEKIHDARALARFQRETEVIANLDHPNIVKAYDAGESGGEYFLVMELLDGVNLSDLVDVDGVLGIADACELVRQAALGLQHAHENGLIHRDLKPSNLFLTRSGTLKIVDLGLARLAEHGSGEHSLTELGEMVGSVDYMAPEQGLLQAPVDIRADLYGLGCTFYKLLAGAAPFSGPSFESIRRKLVAHAQEAAPPITHHRPDLPAALVDLIERLMAKSPNDRPASPSEVAIFLEPLATGSDLARLVALSSPPPARPVESQPNLGPNPFSTTALVKDDLGTTIREEPEDTDSPSGDDRFIDVKNASVDSSKNNFLPRFAKALLGEGERENSKSGMALSIAIISLAVIAICLTVGLVVVVTGKRTTPPVTPAEFRQGVTYPLLQTRPVPWPWPDPPLNSQYTYNEQNRSLLVHSEIPAVFRLGDSKSVRKYDFEIALQQSRWTGDIGIVFGGHPVVSGGKDWVAYQSIRIQRSLDNSEIFELFRFRETFSFVDQSGSSMALARHSIPTPKLGEEHRLAITVSERGLESVRWDSNEVAGLADPLPDNWLKLTDADYRGYFGVIIEKTDAFFQDGSFLKY